MTKKIRVIFVVAAMLLVSILPSALFGLTVHASEQETVVTEVKKNEKWIAFEEEVAQLQETKRNNALMRSDLEDTAISTTEYFALVEKYDGAEITVIQPRASYSEKLVNGGHNAFAYSKSSMESLRSDYGKMATSLIASGAAGGAMAAGPVGALIGAVGSNVLAGHFRAANNDMKRWIDAGSSKGGCRVTLTEEFPISSLNSTSQSAIKKL